MKKILTFILLLSLCCLATAGCDEEKNENTNEQQGDSFEMTATVMELGEKISVNVTASEYAEGQYLVNVADTVEILNAEGEKIKRADLAVGDTVKIWYTGQVTMSIPPQIIALKIQKQ